MKKLLLIVALSALTTADAFAEGTIRPLPGIFGRVRFDCNGDGLADRLATSADGLELHLYYGPEGSTSSEELTHFPQFAVIEDIRGQWSGLPTILQVPGTQAGTYAALQFRILTPNGILAETEIRQVLLGAENGPGSIVWQGVDHPSRFRYLNGPYPDPLGVCVPETSTLTLAGVAGLFAAAFSYHRTRKRSSARK